MRAKPRTFTFLFHRLSVAPLVALLPAFSLAASITALTGAMPVVAYAACIDDADGDTICDLDDPCPDDGLDDADGDGKCAGALFNAPKTGGFDNCPSDANGSQQDTDADGRGDACDLCPTAAGAAEDLCLTTGFWTTRAPAINTRHEGSMIQVGGLNYLIGGEEPLANITEVYETSTNTWTQITSLPAKRHHIQPVTVNGKIYVIGGLLIWPGPSVNTVLMFDPAHPELGWQTRAPMPTSRGAMGCAADGIRIYCAGGLSSTTANTAIATMEVYNTVTNTWATLTPMPRPRDHFQATIIEGRFYAISGRDTAVLAKYDINDVYDIATDTWSQGAPIPTPRGGYALAVMQGRIIVIGGEGDGPSMGTFPNVEEYDPRRNVWRALTNIPTPRHGIGVAVSKVEDPTMERAYVATGAPKQGGSRTTVHEVFAYHTSNLVCISPGTDPTLAVVDKNPFSRTIEYTAGADNDPVLNSLSSKLLFPNGTVNVNSVGYEWITYKMNAALPGNWYMWGRFYYPSPPGGAHSFFAKLDNQAWFKFGGHATLYQKFHWDGRAVSDTKQDGYLLGPLQGGPHLVAVAKREVTPIAPRLDVICLSQSLLVPPTDLAACAAGAVCVP